MNLYDVRIVTADVTRLVRFYEQVTGLAATSLDPGEYVELRMPGGVLAISSQRKIDARSPGAASPAANRSAIIDFRVDDVDRERARLDGMVEMVLEPTDQPWGNRAMLFRDPDGNLVNFFHPIRK